VQGLRLLGLVRPPGGGGRFVAVEKIKDRLLANNAEGTSWVPEAIKEKRFHNWLESAATGPSAAAASGARRCPSGAPKMAPRFASLAPWQSSRSCLAAR